jgi:hypothetical protein
MWVYLFFHYHLTAGIAVKHFHYTLQPGIAEKQSPSEVNSIDNDLFQNHHRVGNFPSDTELTYC